MAVKGALAATIGLLAAVIFTAQACGDDVSPGTLIAVDAKTGQELWRVQPPMAYMRPPVIADGKVSVEGGNSCRSSDGTLATFDARTGAALSTSAAAVGCSKEQPPYENASLTVSPEGASIDDRFPIVARDKKTGQERWRALLPGTPYPPIVLTEKVVATLIEHFTEPAMRYVAIALDVETGRELWQQPVELPDPSVIPHICADAVNVYAFVGSGGPAGIAMESLRALDATSGAVRWERSGPQIPGGGQLTCGEQVAIIAGGADAIAFDRDGKELWRKSLPGSLLTEVTPFEGVLYLAVWGEPEPPAGD